MGNAAAPLGIGNLNNPEFGKAVHPKNLEMHEQVRLPLA